MNHPVIPIVDPQADQRCAGRQALVARPLRLAGDAAALQDLLAVLAESLAEVPELLPPQTPPQAWARALTLADGEADLLLAAELGCRGTAVAQLCFDVMRRRLHDTDVFVRLEPAGADAACPH